MWFRRKRSVLPLDLSALDRLAELIERIIALLPDVAGALEAAPEPDPPNALSVETTQSPPASDHLLFVAGSEGYRLVERVGASPGPGERVELDGRTYEVLRVGPSPLPLDRRRCAFLEREERAPAERSPDG